MASSDKMASPKHHCCFLLLSVLAFSTILASHGVTEPVFACDTATNPSLSSLQFCNSTLAINERIQDLIGRLNLTEKIKFLAAGTVPSVERLGIPIYPWLAEALLGLINSGRNTVFNNLIPAATNFPQVILTAASFNTSLFQAIGKVQFFTFQNSSFLYGTKINLFRFPF